MAYQRQRHGANWWDFTWNPVGGCFAVSPGCKNCYAQHIAGTQQTFHRVAVHESVTDWVRGRPVFNGNLTVAEPDHAVWLEPLKFRGAEHPMLGAGQPSLIFVSDMADLFAENRSTEVIDQVISTIVHSKHIGQLLTKRADVLAAYFSAPDIDRRTSWREKFWLGFTAERQIEFDERWAQMRPLAERGWTFFVSVAPMLAPVMLPTDFLAYGNQAWVICSGEQPCGGQATRLMDPDWARALRDQCREADVPFFLLQMTGGRWAPIPADLFIRQFPKRERK